MNLSFGVLYRLQAILLRAAAENAADESMKTDPVGLPILFLICLALPVFFIGRFQYGKTGRIVIAVIFGLIDCFITMAVMMASMGAGTPLAVITGIGSGGLLLCIVIAFGQKMGNWFSKHEVDVDYFNKKRGKLK